MCVNAIDTLIIDEEGQATPQAAVGLLWRCKHTIVVGDPLQVESAVTDETTMITDVLKKNNEKISDYTIIVEILFTVTQVSSLLHTNKNYVYDLISRGLLPALKLGSYKVRKSTLDIFLEQYEGYDLTDLSDIKNINTEERNFVHHLST